MSPPAMAQCAPTPRNRLLAALPPASYARLVPALEPVALPAKQILYEQHAPITHVYFPESAVVSLVTQMDDGSAVESVIVGNDGMVGLPLFLGVPTDVCQAIVQVPDGGLRMAAAAFQAAAAQDAALRGILGRYTQVVIAQMAQSGACNRLHALEQRCARWLLETSDRVEADQFLLTQEFMATMLGVRRSSVSLAAGTLQQADLIRYRRGHITVLDRDGLENAACPCYRIIADVADRLLPGRLRPSH